MGPPVNGAGTRHEILDKMLEEDGRLAEKTRKILVLGARGSGKATFMRHVKCLYEGYTEQERQEFKNLIYAKIIAIFSSLSDEIFPTSQIQECRRILFSPPENGVLNVELIDTIHTLWTDEDVGEAIPTSQLDASALHFLNSIDRIASPDYIPTDSDILRCNVQPAPPLDQISVKIHQWTFSLVSVRQNLDTKHKWLSFFDSIPSLIFLINLDDYDQPERMREAVDLFDYVCSSPFFDRTAIHIVLNNSDSFLTKLPRSPLSAMFPDYSGGSDYLPSVKYILWRFLTLNHTRRTTYPHLLDVMDANTVRATMGGVVWTFAPRLCRG